MDNSIADPARFAADNSLLAHPWGDYIEVDLRVLFMYPQFDARNFQYVIGLICAGCPRNTIYRVLNNLLVTMSEGRPLDEEALGAQFYQQQHKGLRLLISGILRKSPEKQYSRAFDYFNALTQCHDKDFKDWIRFYSWLVSIYARDHEPIRRAWLNTMPEELRAFATFQLDTA